MCRVAGRGEPGREPKGRVISGFKADFQPTRLIHPPFQVCKVNSFVLLMNVICNISNNNDYFNSSNRNNDYNDIMIMIIRRNKKKYLNEAK